MSAYLGALNGYFYFRLSPLESPNEQCSIVLMHSQDITGRDVFGALLDCLVLFPIIPTKGFHEDNGLVESIAVIIFWHMRQRDLRVGERQPQMTGIIGLGSGASEA